MGPTHVLRAVVEPSSTQCSRDGVPACRRKPSRGLASAPPTASPSGRSGTHPARRDGTLPAAEQGSAQSPSVRHLATPPAMSWTRCVSAQAVQAWGRWEQAWMHSANIRRPMLPTCIGEVSSMVLTEWVAVRSFVDPRDRRPRPPGHRPRTAPAPRTEGPNLEGFVKIAARHGHRPWSPQWWETPPLLGFRADAGPWRGRGGPLSHELRIGNSRVSLRNVLVTAAAVKGWPPSGYCVLGAAYGLQSVVSVNVY